MISARKQFAEKGFRDASIRTICKDAGVTNGAFYSHFNSKEDLFRSIVTPCLKGLSEMYSSEKEHYFKVSSFEDILTAFKESYSSYEKAICYVCEHRDEFLLLLDSSAGTEFEGFPGDLIVAETENTLKFLTLSKKYIKNTQNVSENLSRLGASYMIMTIFDGLRNGLSAEDIIKETALVSEYCIAGYKHMLSI
ncbi:MAG: TetR/AcrR family transcriptional regulator [Lachnospiraceae bacterium]|nr:TetR/AcrR family transcriptional regulator [Lachnospiraceae bacterium]